jgi:hypothetical protein
MAERGRPRLRRLWRGLAAILLLWLVLAYFFLPWAWWLAERGRHPQLETLPVRTTNADGIPGDPINVGLVGTREELIGAMLAAGWYPAVPTRTPPSVRSTCSAAGRTSPSSRRSVAAPTAAIMSAGG